VQGADPPDCDRDVETVLAEAGFYVPELFFSSLFWGGWIATRRP
jgi:tRNA (cmo5U34)-methyltransferase